MAFTIVTGKVGGGKSYFLAETALRACKEGAMVHYCFPLVEEEFERLGFKDQLVKLPRDPYTWVYRDGTLNENGEEILKSDCIFTGKEDFENIILLDEAAMIFRVEEQLKNKDKKGPVFDLLALQRHGGLDIYFAAQSQKAIDAKFKTMANKRIHCTNWEKVALIGGFASILFGKFKRKVYEGEDTVPIDSFSVRFSKAVGKAYRTHGEKTRLAFREGGASRVKKVNSSSIRGYLLIGGAMCAGLLAVYQAWRFMQPAKTAPASTATAPAASGSAAPGASAPVDSPSRLRPGVKHKAGSGLMAIEWDESDEFIYCGSITTKNELVILGEGERFTLGGYARGSFVSSITPWRGCHFIGLEDGRWLCGRPITLNERAERTASWNTTSRSPSKPQPSPSSPSASQSWLEAMSLKQSSAQATP